MIAIFMTNDVSLRKNCSFQGGLRYLQIVLSYLSLSLEKKLA